MTITEATALAKEATQASFYSPHYSRFFKIGKFYVRLENIGLTGLEMLYGSSKPPRDTFSIGGRQGSPQFLIGLSRGSLVSCIVGWLCFIDNCEDIISKDLEIAGGCVYYNMVSSGRRVIKRPRIEQAT